MADRKDSEQTTMKSGSVKVQKTNTIERKILKSDFQSVGVQDQDAVEFTRDNDFTASVSEAAAKHLVEKDDFKRV